MSLLVGVLFFMDFKQKQRTLDERLFSQMKLCSYTLECEEFKIDFVPKKEQETYRLYKEKSGLVSYFPIFSSQKNLLVISLSKKSYEKRLVEIKRTILLHFLLVEIAVLVLSTLFSLFALKPLRDALNLTEEFIKDILHDFNTPISTLTLNISMLASKYREDKRFKRIQNALGTILMLQKNLKAYLEQSALEQSAFVLDELVKERVESLARPYEDISVTVDIPPNVVLETNKDSFVRIIDNLLSNALKYNKPGGYVKVFFKEKTLFIEDGGMGIKNPKKVFERFYKENQRGIGIGLHIVKKLCDSLGIRIELQSEVGKGTLFKLYLDKIAKNL